MSRNLVVVGTQWGDEGKGKVTDLISGDFDVVCRYAGGANAGHTVIANGHKLALHQVPSGVMYDGTYPVIGNGCIVDPEVLLGEIDMLEAQGISCDELRISGNAHIVMPYHKDLDGAHEKRLGKNLIGAFYQPDAVFMDLDLLRTLPKREILAGLGEIIKYGIIYDADFFAWLGEHCADVLALEPAAAAYMIARSCAIKADVVRQDEREGGLRRILNFGHTIAHAIEKETGYVRYRHGEAVAIGCVFAAHLAWRRGMLSEAEVQRHVDDFSALGLPTFYKGASIDALLEVMLSDKKVRAGVLRFVLLDGVNHPVTVKVNPQEVFDCALSMGMRK